MTLVSGFSAQDLVERREALVGAVGIGRQAEVERDHRRLVRAQRLDRARAVAGADHLIALIGPFELALQAVVVLDDQQDFGLAVSVMRVSVRVRPAGLGGRQE